MEVKGSTAPPIRQNSFWEEDLKKVSALSARLICAEEDEGAAEAVAEAK
jgi:hypothetical protein